VTYYILHEGHVQAAPSLLEWSNWFFVSPSDRVVGRTHVQDVVVVTEFLGVSTDWAGTGLPPLFKTTVYGAAGPRYDSPRYFTLAAAQEGHKYIVEAERLRA